MESNVGRWAFWHDAAHFELKFMEFESELIRTLRRIICLSGKLADKAQRLLIRPIDYFVVVVYPQAVSFISVRVARAAANVQHMQELASEHLHRFIN